MKPIGENKNSLPDNAFRELKEGEEYVPLMKPEEKHREVTAWSVTWGIIMAIVFSAATAYLGLKVGQVFEAAIPITIIAVGLSSATHRKNPLGENVIIQSIGACSSMIVAGAIFTLPALYILQSTPGLEGITVDFLQVFLASALGGILGVLFLIPFRKYFVKDMHGKFPFPEATASTQVLMSGEKSGSQTKSLLAAGAIGGLYDFMVATFGAWNENFTSRFAEWGHTLADKAKVVFSINTSAACRFEVCSNNLRRFSLCLVGHCSWNRNHIPGFGRCRFRTFWECYYCCRSVSRTDLWICEEHRHRCHCGSRCHWCYQKLARHPKCLLFGGKSL